MARIVPGEIDALELLVVVDNETDTLSTIDPGVPQVSEVAARVARTEAGRVHDGHACKVVLDDLCCACHGYSVLATGRRGQETRTVLFDTGPYPDLWLDNARRLGVDLAAIDGVFLSHWHHDHSGALPRVVAAIAQARARAGRTPPFADVHPDRPDQRGLLAADGTLLLLAEEPSFDELAAAGAAVVRWAEPHLVGGGGVDGGGDRAGAGFCVPGMFDSLGGASPPANLVEVKASEAQGPAREGWSEGSAEHRCEPTNRNRIEALRGGRAGR